VATPAPVLEEARLLIAQGNADAALSRLGAASQADADVLFLEGVAWATKAETAAAPASGMKPEEREALAFFEKAVGVNPQLAVAHVGTAEVLTPYAVRAAEAARAASGRRPGPAAVEAVVATPDQVIQSYRRAAQADRTSTTIVDAWIDFARKTGRLDEANAGFQELLRRDKEKAAPFVRYGDFLLGDRKDALGAIAQYSQALIWQPNDPEPKTKIAQIYLAQAQAHYDGKEYATALARLQDARRYLDPASPLKARYDQLAAQLAAIRNR
jgi:tetratricopeptide (TPR) repeat protein